MGKPSPKLGDVRCRTIKKPVARDFSWQEKKFTHYVAVEVFFGGKWNFASNQRTFSDAIEVEDKVRGFMADIIREARETDDGK